MTRYIGAALIFFACSGAGFYRACGIRRRVTALNELIAALELLKGEICGRLSDLPRAFKSVEAGAGATVKPFFAALISVQGDLGERPFAQIWSECAQSRLSMLAQGDLAAIISLGAVLGRYDAATQAEGIDCAAAQLKAVHAAAFAAASGNARASIGAGVSIGLMILITLI